MRTSGSLLRYISSLGLALVLALIPMVPVVCGLTCAAHAGARTTAGEHHSCHPSSDENTRVQPVPHACGHQNDDAVGVQELIHILNPPAVVPSAATTPLATLQLQRHGRLLSHSEQRPPGSSPTLTAPLRV